MENITDIRKSKFFLLMNIIMIGYLIMRLYQWLKEGFYNLQHSNSWGVTEFLVNYQGGYVRRGLLGEAIYYIYNAIPSIDPRWYVGSICCISFIIVAWYIYRKFQENNLCWWVLPLNICMLGACDFIRKDYLCALLVIIILQTYAKIKSPRIRCLCVSLLMLFALNIHECIFFMCAPFLMLLYYHEKDMSRPWRWLGITALTISMAIVCIHKGNNEIAQSIWNSWTTAFPEYSNTRPRATIQSIGWGTISTIKMHLKGTYFTRSFIFMGWYSKPLVWCAILFMLPNILFIKRNQKENRFGNDTAFLLQIMIFQFVALFPMFTLLSCDISRICFYWTISSLLIYFTFCKHCADCFLNPHYIKFIHTLQRIIFCRYSKLISILILFIICITPVGTHMMTAFYNSVIGRYLLAMKILIIKLQDVLS